MTAGGVYAPRRDLPDVEKGLLLNAMAFARPQQRQRPWKNPPEQSMLLVIASRLGYLTGLSDYLRWGVFGNLGSLVFQYKNSDGSE